MKEKDTICALSTPQGRGGIGIIRISGPESIVLAQKIFRSTKGVELCDVTSHRIVYGKIVDPRASETVDEALITVMKSPLTYTREDIVEINCHGGPAPLSRTMEMLLSFGARQAEPGEFTRRAFLNGRIDLAQAEAVLDVIRAETAASNKAAQEQLQGGLSAEIEKLRERIIGMLAGVEAGVDFPDEDIETPEGTSLEKSLLSVMDEIRNLQEGYSYGKILREGAATAIIGRPNVGKSSLLNALLRENRAIVTEVPGTTRDVIEESISIDGFPVRIIDTAGIRETHDMVEQEGVRRSIEALERAELVLLVLDGSEPLHEGDRKLLADTAEKETIRVVNKADMHRKLEYNDGAQKEINISCKQGTGLEDLRTAISEILKGKATAVNHAWAVNTRHKQALDITLSSLEKALLSAQEGISPEFIAVDLREALDSIGQIVGATYTEDILNRVFHDFCIGK